MTTTIERLPKRLFAVLLGVVLALGLVPGLGAGVAFAADDTYTLVVKEGTGDPKEVQRENSYTLNNQMTLSIAIPSEWSGVTSATATTNPTDGITIVGTPSVTSDNITVKYKVTKEVEIGKISITAKKGETAALDAEFLVSCTKNTPIDSVKLDQTAIALNKGDTLSLKATVDPTTATHPDLGWKSSDKSVATVDGTGKVTAVAKGTTTITVSSQYYPEKTATCTVTVTESIPVESITLDKKTAKLTVGDKLQLNATVLPKDATDADVGWDSDDLSIAEVDGAGIVTAKGTGEATITATAGGKTATCTVTVTEKPEPTPAPTYAVTDGDDSTWTRGSGKDLTFTFERDADDDTTFKHFKGIQVDGADVKADNYTATEGSVNITLKAAYLEKLKVGKHTITAVFDDGTADAKFTVAKAAASSKSTSPKTGDMLPVALIAGLAILAVIVLIVSRVLSRKQEPTDKNTN